MVEQILLSGCAEVTKDAVREKHREVHNTSQDTEEVEMSTEEFDMVRSKVFNFQSVWSEIISKLRTKTNQRTEICEYKTDTSVDCNLLPIRMFKHYIQTQNYKSK